jgi:hypothetical protein
VEYGGGRACFFVGFSRYGTVWESNINLSFKGELPQKDIKCHQISMYKSFLNPT